MSLRCLFVVQGDGRGHLTQAMSLRRLLVESGHQVEEVLVGKSRSRAIPDFFGDAFEGPVAFVDSPSFVPDADDRCIRPVATLVHEARRAPAFWRSLDAIDRAIERCDPDVVVNFFEPLMGVYTMLYRPAVPVVAVAHQYMFFHPAYDFPPGRRGQRWVVQAVARAAGWGATRRLALSLYPAPDLEAEKLSVLPPLLREDVFEQPTGTRAPFFLAYILNSGYADEIIRWHEQNPDVQIHCFWDRPDADRVEAYDDTLVFHQLDDEKFLEMMARSKGMVSTAGFESVAEAMYLGTPVQVVPVDGHFEQLCNAFDTVRAGAGIRSSEFDVNRLQNFLPRYTDDGAQFRHWVHRARPRFVREIEAVAARDDVPVPASSVAAEPQVLETV